MPTDRAKTVVTKPELGRHLVERTRRAAVPFAWVAADSLYGQDRALRAALQRRGKGYVMAVPCDETVVTAGTRPVRVDELAARIPLVFERRSCGNGAKGERFYDWALAEVTWPSAAGPARKGWQHLVLVRRSLSDPASWRSRRPLARGHRRRHAGTGRGHAVGRGGLLRDRQERLRPGPLRGP
ncbi:transposase, partial [Streptomyces osmaniensis]|uniref:transposase n=1 Tax=Streptomyces osmaniensis TaxID=593134 RepID=UPI0031FBC30D